MESRFAAAEWYLDFELTQGRARAPARAGAPPAAVPPSNGSKPAAAPPEPPAPPAPPPEPRPAAATRNGAPPFVRAVRLLRSHPKRSAAMLAAVVAAGVAVLAITTGRTAPHHAPAAAHAGGATTSPPPPGAATTPEPPGAATTATPPAATAPPAAPPAVIHTPTNVQATGRAFTVAGASFLAIASPRETWTLFSTHVDPGAGLRWELVSVTVKNLARPGFDPRRLPYRIVDASGTAYYPVKNRGTTPAATLPLQSLPKGASTETQLAFRAPKTAKRLQLRFNPTTKPYRVEVPLGR